MKKNEKKIGGYFLELLPSDVQSKIVANLTKFHPNGVAEQIVRLKSEKFLNLADFVASLFSWNESNEGREYWENIIDKKYDGKDLQEAMGELFDVKLVGISDILSKRLNEILSDLFDGKKITNYEDENYSSYKTGFEYAKELTDREFDKFVSNIEAIGRSSEDYLEGRYSSFSDFIGSAFPFLATKQGGDYWAKIRNRKVSETLDDVLSELNIPKSE